MGGFAIAPSKLTQNWARICWKSVQLVRGSSIQNDLLQNSYFTYKFTVFFWFVPFIWTSAFNFLFSDHTYYIPLSTFDICIAFVWLKTKSHTKVFERCTLFTLKCSLKWNKIQDALYKGKNFSCSYNNLINTSNKCSNSLK